MPTDRNLTTIAVGLNLEAWFGLILSPLSVKLGLQPFWGLLAIAGVIFAIHRLSARTPISARTPTIHPSKPAIRGGQVAKFSPMALLSLLTLGPALCPPGGWDELVYHHELPRRWLVERWPAVYLDLPYSGFPSLGEILFWIVAPVESVIAPRLLNWIGWMVGLAMFYRVLRRIVRPNLAAVILLALASSSALLMISANCYVEGLQLMNVAGLLLLVGNRRICEQFPNRTAIMLGVLAGGSVAIKLTGFAVLALPVVWLLFNRNRIKRPTLATNRFLAMYAAAALCIALPFYLRPWLATGDPFYPYYSQWFSADVARLEMSRYHHELGSAFGIHGVIGLIFGPILLAFDRQLYDGDFGWQFLILLSLAGYAAFVGRKRWQGSVAFVSAALLFAFWFLTAQQARFLIPASLLVAIGAAAGVRRLYPRWHLCVALLLVAAALLSAPWRTRGHYLGSWMCVLGVISQEAYVDISTDGEYVPLVAAIRENTAADAHLMLLFEHRGFYIPRRHQIGTPFFQERGFTPPEQFADAKAILALLSRENITHVVVTTKPTGPDIPDAWLERLNPLLAALNECIRDKQVMPIWQSDRHILYEVR